MKFYLFALSFFAVACGNAEKDTATSEPTSEATSEPTAEPASSPTNEPESTDCSSLASGQECFECFADENMSGYTAYADALITNCYCGTECGTDCANFCASDDATTNPSAECSTCVQTVTGDQASECISGFSAACQANAECVAFANDVTTCPQ